MKSMWAMNEGMEFRDFLYLYNGSSTSELKDIRSLGIVDGYRIKGK